MKTSSFKTKICFLFIFITLGTGLCLSQHSNDMVIPNSIPCYCQETNIWCGAATAQMIMEGYPGGVDNVYTQTFIWNTIQTYLNDPGVNWATDPDGLRDTLMDLGAGPGVNWSIHAEPNSSDLLYNVAYWIEKREYPVATLVYGWQHWIVIVGIETDVNPTTTTTVNLQNIRIFNPSNNPCPTATSGGVDSTMNDTQWFSSYWYAAGNYPASKWHGNYIAVIEPPVQNGTVKKPEKKISQGRLISPDQAIEYAYRALKENKFAETYRVFNNIKHLKPILVNQKRNGYYAIPFGYEQGNISHGAILVNAYTGEFQEIGQFTQPKTLLGEDEAIRLALNYTKCDCESYVEYAHLVFQPSMQTNTPFLPVWEVFISNPELKKKGIKSLLVSMDKIVTEGFIPLPLGD